jgi:hypothetical protein
VSAAEIGLCGSCEGRGCDDCEDGKICLWCGDAARAVGDDCSCCEHGAPPHMGCPDCEREQLDDSLDRTVYLRPGAAA